MPNAQKRAIVADMEAVVAQSSGAIFTDYRGLTVAEVTRLRRRLRPLETEYHVVKNSLFRLALGDRLNAEIDALLEGPTAIAFTSGDVIAPTKALLDFLRELRKPEIKVKGGWIDGRLYTVAQVGELAKLPGRPVLLAQLVGVLQGRMSEFVSTLNNLVGDFVRTVDAVARERGTQESAASAPPPEASAPAAAPMAAETTAAETRAASAEEEESAPVQEAVDQAGEQSKSAADATPPDQPAAASAEPDVPAGDDSAEEPEPEAAAPEDAAPAEADGAPE